METDHRPIALSALARGLRLWGAITPERRHAATPSPTGHRSDPKGAEAMIDNFELIILRITIGVVAVIGVVFATGYIYV